MKTQVANPRHGVSARFLNMTSRLSRWRPEEHFAVLPQMNQLIAALKERPSANDLDRFGRTECRDVLPYRIQIETGRPCIRFNILEADVRLLSFVGQQAAPFEVLQLSCAGFQYHWRSDLARVLEDRVPLIGRVFMLTDRLDIVADHLAIPVSGHRGLIEIRGWFALSRRIGETRESFQWSEVAIVRRSQRSRQISLPSRLLNLNTSRFAGRFRLRRDTAALGAGFAAARRT